MLLAAATVFCGCDRSAPPAADPGSATAIEPPRSVPSSADSGAEPTAELELPAFTGLRLGMRPGLSGAGRPSTPAEVGAAVAGAGGSLDCGEIGWASDEEGVLDGSCEGKLAIADESVRLRVTFRRFEIPGDDGRAGLLTIQLFGPALGSEQLEPWLQATRGQLEAAHGSGRVAGGDVRWHLDDRYLLLHDPRTAPCGGSCTATLWIGGRHHPELSGRGF